ncbi:MAG: translational machinery protein, partial [Pseudolabrys sp.]
LRKRSNPMNSPHYHAVIWVDHREARIFHLTPTDVQRSVLHPDHPTKHIHHKANSIGSGHAQEDQNYFQAIMEAVAGSGAVLITGPANAKTELVKHIHQHDPRMMKTVVGIETVDHPSDAQLVAHARKYFEGTDRMQPQIR